MHSAEFAYYAKKAFALFPGGADATSAPVFAAHYARRRRNLSLCVKLTDLDRASPLLDEVAAEFGPELIERREPVVKLTLYGPHFNERYALVAEIFSALSTQGVDVHTVGSSVNSISFVMDAADRDRTIACLRERFDWPE